MAIPLPAETRLIPVDSNHSVISSWFAQNVINGTIPCDVYNGKLRFTLGVGRIFIFDERYVINGNDIYWLVEPIQDGGDLMQERLVRHCIQTGPPAEEYNGYELSDLISALNVECSAEEFYIRTG